MRPARRGGQKKSAKLGVVSKFVDSFSHAQKSPISCMHSL